MPISICISGGEIKAALLGGMLAKLLESGVIPSEVTGTSAGALNAFMVAGFSAQGMNLQTVGSEIRHAYATKINSPDQFARERGTTELVKNFLLSEIGFGKWQGYLDVTKLRDFIRNFFPSTVDFSKSAIDCYVTAFDVNFGRTIVVSNKHPNFVEYVIASTSVPLIMSPLEVDGKTYFDGGVEQYLPFPKQRDLVIALLSSPVGLGKTGPTFSAYRVSHIAKRMLNALTNDTASANIQDIQHDATKLIKIAPDVEPPFSITKFTKQDILDMVSQGDALASDKLKEILSYGQ